jgi:PAS domain S-box-containing protein
MDGFWVVDRQGCLLEVNETYCRIRGYSAQKLIGMSLSDLEVNETSEEVARLPGELRHCAAMLEQRVAKRTAEHGTKQADRHNQGKRSTLAGSH